MEFVGTIFSSHRMDVHRCFARIVAFATVFAATACDGDASSSGTADVGAQRQAFTLELVDGGRIESWVEGDVVEAERSSADGDVVLWAKWDLELGTITLERAGSATELAAGLDVQPGVGESEALAIWLDAYDTQAGPGHADELTGSVRPTTVVSSTGIASGTLNYGAAAADVYTFTCPAGTSSVRGNSMDLNTITNRDVAVRNTFGKIGSSTVWVEDTESTSTTSPYVSVAQGPGSYRARITKRSTSGGTTVNVEDYVVRLQCLNAASAVIGPNNFALATDG